MDLEFLSRGLAVPYTIITSPYAHKREVELSLTELAKLVRPFIIKPANTTGGGIGVVLGAESLNDAIETRQHHKNDKYLLQEKVDPTSFGEKRACFRVFYAFGSTIPCWWDDQTHIYDQLTPEEEETSFRLTPPSVNRTDDPGNLSARLFLNRNCGSTRWEIRCGQLCE